ncbi:hypothetical protein GGR57DRAFT_480549 [Xylariaceae sp. FL1272]|nr:hypothetical protein GGR57DRAFT_480549 [Xylariaceae sp. FL1272]
MAEVFAAVFVPNLPDEIYFTSQMRLGAAWYHWCIWVEDHRGSSWPLAAHNWLPSVFGKKKTVCHRFDVVYKPEEEPTATNASKDKEGDEKGSKPTSTYVDEKTGEVVETYSMHADSGRPFEETNRRLSPTCVFVHATDPTTPDGKPVRPAAKVSLGWLSDAEGIAGSGYTLESMLHDQFMMGRQWIGTDVPGLQMRWTKKAVSIIRNCYVRSGGVQWSDDWVLKRVVGIAGAGSEEAWDEMEYRRNPYMSSSQY